MRPIGKLKALTVAREKRPGMYGDGGGLWLQVTGAGAKSWIFRYWVPERDPATGELVRDPTTGKPRGVAREMGLGSVSVVSLEAGRLRALECRQQRERGLDPIAVRRDAKVQTALEQAKSMTFRQCAESYISAHRAGWRSDKHAAQWPTTLATYAYPAIGALPVASVDTALVMKVLEPIWTAKPETASRVRGRVESILDFAKARGFRAGENPARWRGHLDCLLPAKAKLAKVEHHAALPYLELGAFMADLRRRESTSARCLEFAILCAARTNEALGARRDEIDLQAKLWTVPAERMKGGRAHRVPLAARAVQIIREQQARRETSEYLFPGRRGGAPLSATTLRDVLHAVGRSDVTTHGMRASFKTWASERTNFPRELIEAALAHIVGDATERAYARGDALDKRRKLMTAWAEYCEKSAPAQADKKVVALRLG